MGFLRTYIRKTLSTIGVREVSKAKVKRFLSEVNNVPQKRNLNEMSIAVIIPCYGHERVLEETFDSIANQARQPNEAIFVVDASPDKSYELLQKLIKNNKSKIKFNLIKNKKNLGQAESLNVGIRAAKSEIIMILNDDDYLFKDIIQKSLKCIKENNIWLLGWDAICLDSKNKFSQSKKLKISEYKSKIKITIRKPEDAIKYTKYNDINMCHSGTTFLKSGWKTVGGYLPKDKRLVNFSDRDFQLRINLTFNVGVSNAPACFWRNDQSVDSGLNS